MSDLLMREVREKKREREREILDERIVREEKREKETGREK